MKTLFALLLSLLFSAAHAETTAVIKEVDANNKVIAIQAKGGETKPGDRWVWQSGDESCVFQVYTVRGSIASAKSSECESIKKVKSGQDLKLSLIDTEAPAPVVTPTAQPKRPDRVEKPRNNPDLPTDNEEWYILFGGGFAGAAYQGKFKDTVKAIDDLPGSTKRTGGLAMELGVYFPTSSFKSMIGGNIELTGDGYSNETAAGDYRASIGQALVAISAYRFFGENIGNGWFIRGDLGVAKTTMILEQPGLSNQLTEKTGFGALFGGGYAIPCGTETRVLFFINMSGRSFGGDRFRTLTLGADFLF